MLWMMIHYQTLNINEGENRRIDRFKNSLPVILFSDMAPNAVPDRSKASSIGITFNRWLKNPKDNGNIGEKMKPVIAPRSDKLANVKPIIQTKSSQAIKRANAPNQIILKHFVTDTYTDTTASVSRPIYFDERLRVKLSKSFPRLQGGSCEKKLFVCLCVCVRSKEHRYLNFLEKCLWRVFRYSGVACGVGGRGVLDDPKGSKEHRYLNFLRRCIPSDFSSRCSTTGWNKQYS